MSAPAARAVADGERIAALTSLRFIAAFAVATAKRVLIELPVMLLIVRIVNNSKAWYERA